LLFKVAYLLMILLICWLYSQKNESHEDFF